MFLKKFFFVPAFVIGCVYNCIAQHSDLTGTYTGNLFQGDESYSFDITLELKQTGNAITGTLKSQSEGKSRFFVIYNIEGTTDGNVVEWKDVSIADEFSSSTWFWCKKQVEGKITVNNDNIVLSCNWKSDGKMMFHKKELVEKSGVSCPPGSFRLSKENDIKQIKKTGDSVFLDRGIDVAQRVDVVSDSVQLSFYDNGEVDNDTITVYYNKAVIINHQRLSTNPLIVTIPVPKNDDNELVMFANNEGEIPPNSALLVFTDNGIRREITMVSSLKRSGALIFNKK